MAEEALPDPDPPMGLKVEWAIGLCRDQSHKDTQLSAGNAQLWSRETQPHWRSEQIYDFHTRSSSQVHWISWKIQGSHDGVYIDGSKMNERVRAAVVINRHFQNGETTCRHLSKRLPDNSTIFAAEATAITLTLGYYRHMDAVRHDAVVCSDSVPCLQAIESEDTENTFICHIMNLLWFVEWQRQMHTCSFLLDTKPLWYWGKWKSGSASKRDPWPWHRPSDKCLLRRFGATSELLYQAVGSNQMGCSCTWQRSLSLKTNTRAT